ncbi:MAG TPA: tetratricopeptide repeat protein [Rhodanobacter sp.]|nr:tetratricopeptide repeat protein [Rhodanobacter sp.]
MNAATLLAELRRRNVLRAGVLYIGTIWALAQGIAQLGPSFGTPDWVTRWFVIAGAIGFPFWLAFAWFYEFTPSGLKRESEVAPGDSIAHSTGRKLDFWIIGVLAVAVVLLLTNQLVRRHDATDVASRHTPADATPALTGIPQKSIAVLPLVNGSGNQDEQYFSDGLSEDLITALSQFDGLKVISRDSSFQFRRSKDSSKVIGEKLGVAHLLEGSVRRAGGEVRISAELVNAADGSTLWSQHYDRPYTDLFKLQDDITQAVADALKAKLLSGHGAVVQSDRPPSGNLDAYSAFLQGSAYYAHGDEAGARKAIEAFNRAIALDPHYARAYAALSHAWTHLGGTFLGGAAQRQAYDTARVAVDKALKLDPNSAAAYLARGYLAYFEFDWSRAHADFQRALQLAPNDGDAKYNFGALLSTLGQLDQALDLTRQALTTNPQNGSWNYALSQYLLAVGRTGEAEQALRTGIALTPQNAALYEQLAIIEILRGDAGAALAAAQREPPGPWHDIAVALALQIGSDRTAADAALKGLIGKYADTGPYQIAEVYALRKDPDPMFQWLGQAWNSHDPGISSLLYDPLILRYKDDPRFAAFCRKVGLPIPGDTIGTPGGPASAALPASATLATP